MSDYKNYLLSAMGIPKSRVDEINKKELAMGAKDEKGEHGMTDAKAKETAKQHLSEPDQAHYYSGMEKAKKAGMFKEKKVEEGLLSTAIKSPIFSPTAIATPVIGVAVRGSSTGGLPSGIDQTSGDISPSRMGGYEKVAVDPANSKLVNKTPQNPEINSSNPINDFPKTGDGVTHPHQVQRNAGEQPQGVTGASTDSDNTLKLKSAMPKGIDVDVADENKEDKSSDGNGDPNKEKGFGRMNESDDKDPNAKAYNRLKQLKKMIAGTPESNAAKKQQLQAEYDRLMKTLHESNFSETFARHKELLREKLRIKESTCKCGNPDCTCGCKSETTDECKSCGCGKPNTSHDMKENVGAEEPFANKFGMDKEKAGLVKLSEAFDKLNVTAGRPPTKEEPKKPESVKKKYFDPKTKTVRDVDWVESPKEEVKEYSAPFERMRGLANLGERRVMADGMWGDTTISEVNHTKDSAGNWVIAVGAPGSDARNAVEKGAKCKSCGKSFTPSHGEYSRCPDCLSSQHDAAEKATGVQEGTTTTERLTHIKKGLEKKSKRGTLSDKEARLFRQINEALTKRGV